MRCIQEAYSKYRLSLVRLRREHKLLRRRGETGAVLSPNSIKLKKDFTSSAGSQDIGKGDLATNPAVTSLSLHAIESDPYVLERQSVLFEVKRSFILCKTYLIRFCRFLD
jgi:hypothetical protein